MLNRLAEMIRGMDRRGDTYSRALQAARVRASYQRAYFAPALFNMNPIQTDEIASMAVDAHWRLYYNDAWLRSHTVEENAAVLIHLCDELSMRHVAAPTGSFTSTVIGVVLRLRSVIAYSTS